MINLLLDTMPPLQDPTGGIAAGIGAGVVAVLWAARELFGQRKDRQQNDQSLQCALDHQEQIAEQKALRSIHERQATALEDMRDVLISIDAAGKLQEFAREITANIKPQKNNKDL